MQDHIKPAAWAVLDAIIDEIEAAESPAESDDDSDAADEAAGDGSSQAALASPPKSLQARNFAKHIPLFMLRVAAGVPHPALTLGPTVLA